MPNSVQTRQSNFKFNHGRSGNFNFLTNDYNPLLFSIFKWSSNRCSMKSMSNDIRSGFIELYFTWWYQWRHSEENVQYGVDGVKCITNWYLDMCNLIKLACSSSMHMHIVSVLEWYSVGSICRLISASRIYFLPSPTFTASLTSSADWEMSSKRSILSHLISSCLVDQLHGSRYEVEYGIEHY